VRKTLFVIAALVIAMVLSCGSKTEAPKKVAPKAETPAAVAANLPAGWPAETFTELSKAEIDGYAKALPGAMAALKKAGYKPVASEPPDLVKDMASSIEKMKATAGFEDALKAGNTTWNAFRITTYKVMAANMAMAVSMGEAMTAGAADSVSAEAKAVKAMIKKAKATFDQVPKKNGEMIFTYMDQLKPLDDIDNMGK
jgi:PBP1b-binding outer membrane lipoprotein LpoB